MNDAPRLQAFEHEQRIKSTGILSNDSSMSEGTLQEYSSLGKAARLTIEFGDFATKNHHEISAS